MNFQNVCFFGLLLTFPSFVNSQKGSIPKNTAATSPKNAQVPEFMVSIQLYPNKASDWGLNHFCDGTIISPKKVLTAAHCVFKPHGGRYLPFELLVLVGLKNRFIRSNSTRVLDIANIKSHGQFRRGKTLFANVAILVLKDEIRYDDPDVIFMNLTSFPPKKNQTCIVIGWGKFPEGDQTSDQISFMEVEIRDNTFCKQLYGEKFTNGMICAGYPQNSTKDSCPSGMGGPLICGDTVAGIVSWGMDKCGN